MLELRNIHRSYEGQPLLRGLSFEVGPQETVCLLGASGSGKSTTLQLIAGLDAPDAGQILWDGLDLAATLPYRRDFGLVFQDYALFPHLDVRGNVAFGPRVKGWSPARIDARVAEVLDLVNLTGFERRRPTELSGGEQQRVALARALAPRPRLLMFDEPLGAIDRALREQLLDELRAVLSQARIPAIYVTHDQDEAFEMADRILLLHDGLIVRKGTPRSLWSRPGSRWAAEFLGLGNVLDGHMLTGRRVRTDVGTFSLGCAHRHRGGDAIHLLLRPTLARGGALIRDTVRDVVFVQDGYRVILANGLYFHARQAPRVGAKVSVHFPLECLGSDSQPDVEWAPP